MSDEIVNKVAGSALVTINPEDYYPVEEAMTFDLKPFLFMELVLKEKDFRTSLERLDWNKYLNAIVAIGCTADAIIPQWAYMLVASHLSGIAKDIFFGTERQAIEHRILKNIESVSTDEFMDKRVVIKGCGTKPVGETAYVELTRKLTPVVKSIMYGEPCSTVPVFKRSKTVLSND